MNESFILLDVNILTESSPDDCGDAADPDPSPGSAATIDRVRPWEVERGDRLAGLRTPVDSILQVNGQHWVYGDERGRIIARRPHWGTVQIVRADVMPS